MKIKPIIKNIPKKNLVIYIAILVVIVLAVIFISLLCRDGKITTSDIKGYKNYYSKGLKISFDFKDDYKVKKKDNTLYILKKYKNGEAIKPYITINVAKDYSNPNKYLEDSTNKSKKEYGNTFTPITELSATLVGDKFTSLISYNNFYNDELIVETRYAFAIEGKVYIINSYEVDRPSEEINELCKNIIATLKKESK